MRGLVFTELVEMIEETFSSQLADEILESIPSKSGGAYTSVGTYDHRELASIVLELSRRSGTDVPSLLNAFGRHLFSKFLRQYPAFFEFHSDTFSLLETVDGHIHVEVKKIYPTAELPKFTTQRIDADTFEMIYSSERHLEDLALGLIEATIEHFDESIAIDKRTTQDGTVFSLRVIA